MKVSSFVNHGIQYINDNKTFLFEKIAFLLFSFLIILISYFHEPWFDEFQAWGISRESLYNILFVIPHYEGHPPLWHLIIKCFSVFNINPELCLKIPNTIFIILSAWLIIFKSPFPKIVRLTLPFTYFILYQYGIICRPYSLFSLFLIICAIFFKTRQTNPFRYVCLLAAFSMSSIYAFIISTGIAIAWGFELIDWNNIKQSLKSLFKNKQFFALLLLFAYSVLLSISVYPSEKNTAASFLQFFPIWQKALYCICGVISDATVFNVIKEHFLMYDFFENNIKTVYFCLAVIFGGFLNIFLIKIFKKLGALLFFLIPYLFFMIVFYIYYWPHHSGLILLLIIFCFWISYDKISSTINKQELSILKILTILVIIVQLFWSAVSGIGDILFNYECSREIAQYLKQKQLYNYRIFVGIPYFHFYVDEKREPITNRFVIDIIDRKDNTKYEKRLFDIQNLYLPVIIIPYFNKNIFCNFNADFPDKFYSLHIRNTEETQQEFVKKWKKQDLPDIIINYTKSIWENFDFNDHYILLKQFKLNYIWKGTIIPNYDIVPLYMNKKLYDNLRKINNLSPEEQIYYYSH